MYAAEAEVLMLEGIQDLKYTYPSVELDAPDVRSLIHDFLEHA